MPSDGMSPGEVNSVAPLEAGAGAPTDGISPANTEEERAHVIAIAIRNLFMEVSFES